MDLDSSAKLKNLYNYMEKINNLSNDILKFLDDTVKVINRYSADDDISIFLKELADSSINPFYLKLKQKIDTVNTPVRTFKKGFNKIYQDKIEEFISFLNFLNDNLNLIFRKIENFQEKLLSRNTNLKSFISYYEPFDDEINNYLKNAVHRITQSKFTYFEAELEKIKNMKNPNHIIQFLQNFKDNVNKFITEQLYNNMSGIFNSLKDTVLKKVESYLNEIDIQEKEKQNILNKVEMYLKGYEIIYPLIYFEIPYLSSDFFDPSQKYKSLIDKFTENILSLRFFVIFFTGMLLSIFGIYNLYSTDSEISFYISLSGIFFIFLSIIDAMFFNKKYVKTFLNERKNFLLQFIKGNIHQIENIVLDSVIEQKNSLVKGVNEIILEEFEVYSLGGKKVENLKENIKKFREEVYNLLNQLKSEVEKDAT
jgi:hypothetical protein